MYFLFNDQNIFYEVVGQNNYNYLILLHGWGMNSSTYDVIKSVLKDYYNILTIDFLGFGMSDEPLKPLTLDDYVDQLKAIIEYLKIKNPLILGHSFGGRVAIKYSLRHPISKLILVDSAGIKHRTLKTRYKIWRYKFLKHYYKLFSKSKLEELKKQAGSRDYRNCSEIMKRTMSNIIDENLKKDIKKIDCRTLILWGYYDTITPYNDAVYLNKTIKDSRLITFYRSGHFP